MTCHKMLDISMSRVKYNFYEKVKTLALNSDGIIFGGFVRDKIISEHYESKYFNSVSKDVRDNAFWSESVSPETVHRTLVAEDIDIAFPSMDYADRFINRLASMVKLLVHSKYDLDIVENIKFGKYSALGALESVRTVTYTFLMGYIPFVFQGYNISLSVDVVVPNSRFLLPPFRNLDFLCNAFILTKSGICLSKHTGTHIDSLSEIERSLVSAEIMRDIIRFKTDFVLGTRLCETGTFSLNKYAFKRINKLLSKTPVWCVQNLPFSMEIVKCVDVVTNSCANSCANSCSTQQGECCICMSEFMDGESKVSFYNNKGGIFIPSSTMHKQCLFNYIYAQIQDFESTFDGLDVKFEFKCPFRNGIDFIKCAHKVKDKINEIINI